MRNTTRSVVMVRDTDAVNGDSRLGSVVIAAVLRLVVYWSRINFTTAIQA